jgi:hypothetical protein
VLYVVVFVVDALVVVLVVVLGEVTTGASPVAAETASTPKGPEIGTFTTVESENIVTKAQVNNFNLLFNEIPPINILCN